MKLATMIMLGALGVFFVHKQSVLIGQTAQNDAIGNITPVDNSSLLSMDTPFNLTRPTRPRRNTL